jgi:hypothetical protein
MELEIGPRRITRLLLWAAVFLVGMHLVGQFSALYLGHKSLLGLVRMFDLNGEWNFPAVFSSGLLLFCSILIAVIARAKRRAADSFRRHWQVLAGIFLFLALDELVAFHDRLQAPLASIFHLSGFWYAGWTLPYAIGLVLFLFAYRRFVFHLPRRYLVLFVLSGAIYVGGAMGFESLGAEYLYSLGGVSVSDRGVLWVVLYTVEETAEIGGLILFLYALLNYICTETDGLRLVLAAEKSGTVPAVGRILLD